MKSRRNDVCLLYSESDQDLAGKLEFALNFYSIDVWKTQNIPIGNKIVNETMRVIEQAKVIIVLWSSTSVNSALLKQLASEAKREKKVLIPVLIENVQIPGDFIDIQPANLIGWNGDKENDQIIKLWVLIRDPLLDLYRKRSIFNQVISALSILIALAGAIFTITTPEVRCLLKIECRPPTAPITPNTSDTKPKPIDVFTNKEFTLELKQCQRDIEAIKCEFNVINKQQDGRFSLYANNTDQARAIDSQGNQYLADSVDFGGQKSSYSQDVTQNVVQGIGLKAHLIFREIPSEVNQLALVTLTVVSDNSKTTNTIQFRDVHVSN